MDDHIGIFESIFPTMYFVIRDFHLNLEIDGNPCTPDEYLEHCLRPKPSKSKEGRMKRELIEDIKRCFPKRRCVTIPPPGTDDAELDSQHLNPAFTHHITCFCDMLHQDVAPTEFQSVKMNGGRKFDFFFYNLDI